MDTAVFAKLILDKIDWDWKIRSVFSGSLDIQMPTRIVTVSRHEQPAQREDSAYQMSIRARADHPDQVFPTA